MGRRAKYLTLDAKRAAKRAQTKVYRATDSGRRARAKDNHEQYTKKKAERDMLLGHTAPAELRARGRKALPTSLRIQDDGPLLGLWTAPYDFERPDHDSLARAREQAQGDRWDTVAGVLGGLQYNKLVDICWTRYERWGDIELAEDPMEATLEVAARIHAWEKLRKDAVPDEDREVKEVALDWGARIVCMLAEEWEMRSGGGVSGYREHSRAGRLPWQRMMKEVMRMYH